MILDRERAIAGIFLRGTSHVLPRFPTCLATTRPLAVPAGRAFPMNSREVRFARDRAGAAVPPTLAPTPRSGPGRPHRPRAPFELLNPRVMALALASGVTAGVSVRASSSFVRAKSTSFRAASARAGGRVARPRRAPRCPRRAPALRSRPPRPVRTRARTRVARDARRGRRARHRRGVRGSGGRDDGKDDARRARARVRRRARRDRPRGTRRRLRRDRHHQPGRHRVDSHLDRCVRRERPSASTIPGVQFRSSKSLNFGVFNFGSRIAACTRFSDAFSFRHRSFSLEPRAPAAR